ncbi:hypothetical protein HUC03_00740 [Escherichia coli]|nr:hypothetical protein [Escherichia coli]
MPENPASYRVVRTKSYLFNKALEYVKTGLPGVAWVRVNEELPWPDDLVVRLPQ